MASLNKEVTILTLSVFIAGLCSLVYELLIGTASSYFLGDSVKQFSITIGLYMAAMGCGSMISRLIEHRLISRFISLEIALGFLGGASIPILYFCYAYLTEFYSLCMVVMILAIGILIGLEIPLLTRIMERYYTLKINISNVLTVDYLGALCATILFPFVFLPFLGTFKSSLVFGIVNMGIGFMMLWCFKHELAITTRKYVFMASATVLAFLCVTFLLSGFLLKVWDSALYRDRIIFAKQTKYQNIVLTRFKSDVRLFLNGNLQFSSIDEHRYHESLVHVPFSLAPVPRNVLILGGGDGLAVREVRKYPEVTSITLVDIDPEITELCRKNPLIRQLNQNSLEDPRVTIVHRDAFVFMESTGQLYDVIIADLPDPNNAALARLYSREFYRLVFKRLARMGVFVTQATSPFYARNAFWCIHNTIRESASHTYPYHAYVPSFGDWGFVMASALRLQTDTIHVQVPTRFLDNRMAANLFIFPKDLSDPGAIPSTLDHPQILTYYQKDWNQWD